MDVGVSIDFSIDLIPLTVLLWRPRDIYKILLYYGHSCKIS